jgi:hypothetical protein
MVSLLKSRRFWVVAIAVGLPLLILWHLATRPPLDDRTKAILAGATRVDVFRTDGMNGPLEKKPRAPGEMRIGGFLVTARGQDQGKEFAARLADILFARGTYSWGGSAACFWPGIAFRVWKDEEAVDVLICFKCENFYCGPPTEATMENASFNGSRRRADLVRLAKEAFPDDTEIQELEEHR